jgi:TolB-like protein/class 3 adenylate cyclase/tetratricopeptide (TPR) repeat protein
MPPTISTPPGTSNPAIRTLLLCDLVASTRLVERVGDSTAAELFARHDRIARNLLSAFSGREIDKSDGFLLLFERPIEAVHFALAYQAELRELGATFGAPITSRVGIHLGEVMLRENLPEDVARGAKPLEVEGLAKAIAARVMSLAANGRILLTRAAFDFARRAVVGMKHEPPLHWIVHGRYRLAGVEDLVEVCEVVDFGGAEPTQPPNSEKARRADVNTADALRAQPPTSRHTTNAVTNEPVIAVLAFDNLSSDPEMQFFSDGISEEIIQRLSRGARLKVIGRTSSFQLRGERKAEAVQSLNCSHVLDGAIRRAAGRVRITAHLVEASSGTTLWSDRYDRSLEDIFAVQDEISDSIATALDRTFSSYSTKAIDPAVYDLYLRASPKSFAPDELRMNVGLLEVVTQRAPHFAEAWGRLAYLRAFLHFYEPFADRAASAARVADEATRALAFDPQSNDAMAAQLFVIPPFSRFMETDAALERLRRAPGSGDGRRYIGYMLRTMGRVRESLEETERAYRLDALDSGSANQLALARMAAGRVAEAVPVYEDLVARVPEMSFPVSSLLRAYAFQQDWAAVDRLLELAAKRQLREFQDGLPFIRTKRHPTRENIGGWRSSLQAQVAKTGRLDVSRLVYAAHLGLVDEAYQAAETARLGPAGTSDDIMGPDRYRTHLLFQVGMPELRNDRRFPQLCARLGLVEFWMATGKWPDCVDEVPYDFEAECAKVQHVSKDDFEF